LDLPVVATFVWQFAFLAVAQQFIVRQPQVLAQMPVVGLQQDLSVLQQPGMVQQMPFAQQLPPAQQAGAAWASTGRQATVATARAAVKMFFRTFMEFS